MRRLAAFLALVLLAGCDSNQDPITCDDPSVEIETEDVLLGTGAVANARSVVVVAYRGTLDDGTVFDENTNAQFSLAGTVSGFREGVSGMRVGGRRRIVIPPLRGYGAVPRGSGDSAIPACSTLNFDVTLRDING